MMRQKYVVSTILDEFYVEDTTVTIKKVYNLYIVNLVKICQ